MYLSHIQQKVELYLSWCEQITKNFFVRNQTDDSGNAVDYHNKSKEAWGKRRAFNCEVYAVNRGIFVAPSTSSLSANASLDIHFFYCK